MRSTLRSAPLAAILAHELQRGNSVAQEETAWSRMDLVVRMEKPLDEVFAQGAAEQNSALRTFRTNDPHYGSDEFGVRDGAEAIVAAASDQRS